MDNRISVRYPDLHGSLRADVWPLLEGELEGLPSLPKRIIKVFLSSTFSDMTPERNTLMEHAYPRLKAYCRQKYRFEFQVMDLRWGIREQSVDDHTIVEFCMREIDNCRKTSVGPSFVAFIGQKYGYRPFPTKINSREFEAITSELTKVEGAVALLNVWFKKDANSVPVVYVLQPVSSVLPHFTDMESTALQKEASKEWDKIYCQLQSFLRTGVQSCVDRGILSSHVAEKYFISVTEYEIQRGLLCSPEATNDGLCFMREIANLEKNIDNRRAQKYMDILTMPVDSGSGSRVVVDVDAQRLLETLRKDKILKAMDRLSVVFFRVTWKDVENRSPSDDPDYLERFSNTFCSKMKELIDRCSSRQRQYSAYHTHSQVVEVHQHLAMCLQRSKAFRGREELMEKIRSRLQTRAGDGSGRPATNGHHVILQAPIVLHGQPGCGKTSVMAKTMQSVKYWFPKAKPIIAVRFLGATSRSCSIRLVLGSICWQIASVYNLETCVIPDDYPGLVEHFHCLLQMATSERPLVLILDGLNQLSPDHRAHRLAWLPDVLPPNVYLIVSTLTDHQTFDVLSAMASTLSSSGASSDGHIGFVEVPPLGRALAISLVLEWLKFAGRGLTKRQLTIVGEALNACSLPLYVSLVFDEVRLWSSYDAEDRTTIELTVQAAIARLFDRVERYHGRAFVSHALGYLTASKDGLSDVEMDDILSLDDVVLNDVFQHWVPPVRRLPPLLVPRLQDALGSYVVRREANGTVVLYWYHCEFIGVARRRYLATVSQRVFIHSVLANYFMGTWGGGRRKPFKYSVKQLAYMSQKRNARHVNESETADRMVPKQPLHFGPDERYPGRLNYNLRKLSELPHHLLQSGMISELKSHVLFNYDWLHAKLCALSLQDVLHDFNVAVKSGRPQLTADHDVALVANALRLGGSQIGQNPNSLAFELLGRLLVYYDSRPTSRFLSSSSSSSASNSARSSKIGDDSPAITPSSGTELTPGLQHKVFSPRFPVFSPSYSPPAAGYDPAKVDGDFPSIPEADEEETGGTPSNRRERMRRGPRFEAGINSLLQQCDQHSPSHSALLPILPCFDPPTADALCVLEGHAAVVSDLAFLSPSAASSGGLVPLRGQLAGEDYSEELVSVASDGTVVLWDLGHGGERSRSIDVSRLKPGRQARLYPFGDDSRSVLVDSDATGSPAVVIDLRTGHQIRSFGERQLSGWRSVTSGQRLFCRQRSVYDVSSGSVVCTLEQLCVGTGFVVVALSADDQLILVGGPDKFTRMFDVHTGNLLTVFDAENSTVVPSAIVLSRDGSRALIGYADTCRIAVFDISGAAVSNKSRSSVPVAGRCVLTFDWRTVVPDDDRKLTESQMHQATSAHPDGGNRPMMPPNVEEVCDISVNPVDEDQILINVSRRHLIVFDVNCRRGLAMEVQPLYTMTSSTTSAITRRSITRSLWSGNGQLVLGSTDSALHIWFASSGRLARTIHVHTQAGFPLAVSGPRSRRNLAATGSTLYNAIHVWDLDAAVARSTDIALELDNRNLDDVFSGTVSDANPVPVYDGPVDCISVARSARLVFIRRQISLSTHAGYKYSGWSGLDVWNIADSRPCSALLPFGRNGRLLQIAASPKADRFALLFRADDDSRHVALVNVRSRGSSKTASAGEPYFAEHSGCAAFVVSENWEFLVTWACEKKEFKLWFIGRRKSENGHDSAKTALQLSRDPVTFSGAACGPTFTFDSQYVVYIDIDERSGPNLVVYSLNTMAPRWRTSVPGAISVRSLPVRHDDVLVTCRLDPDMRSSHAATIFGENDDDNNNDAADEISRLARQKPVFGSTKVFVWRLFSKDESRPMVELSGSVGRRRGIRDVSRDGRVAVDGLLQVYSLSDGKIVARFQLPRKRPSMLNGDSSTSSSSSSSDDDDDRPAELTHVRLTDDGRYVIWTEKRAVRVGRVSDSTQIACASTHERPTGLELLDYGYVVIVGCQDGRVLVIRLAASDDGPLKVAAYRPCSAEDRVNFLVDAPSCSDQTIEQIDPVYRLPDRRALIVPAIWKRSELADEAFLSELRRRANRPVAIVTTASGGDWSLAGDERRRHRRRKKHDRQAANAVHPPTSDATSKKSPLPHIIEMWKKTSVQPPEMVDDQQAFVSTPKEARNSISSKLETLPGGLEKIAIVPLKKRLANRRDAFRDDHSCGGGGGVGVRGKKPPGLKLKLHGRTHVDSTVGSGACDDNDDDDDVDETALLPDTSTATAVDCLPTVTLPPTINASSLLAALSTATPQGYRSSRSPRPPSGGGNRRSRGQVETPVHGAAQADDQDDVTGGETYSAGHGEVIHSAIGSCGEMMLKLSGIEFTVQRQPGAVALAQKCGKSATGDRRLSKPSTVEAKRGSNI